jgi:hypothetical protein
MSQEPRLASGLRGDIYESIECRRRHVRAAHMLMAAVNHIQSLSAWWTLLHFILLPCAGYDWVYDWVSMTAAMHGHLH